MRRLALATVLLLALVPVPALADQPHPFAGQRMNPADPGPTCCQAADLLNPVSLLTERIDLVLFRGSFGIDAVEIVGDEPADRTPSGLWPSDHAGVVATLGLPRSARGSVPGSARAGAATP